MSKGQNEIGLNLRVTEYLDQGYRQYMEDCAKAHFEKEGNNIIFAYFGIFDGHGGPEAAQFAKTNLVLEIKAIEKFWSSKDEDVVSAIKEGFLNTHQLMWKERDKWPRTSSGYKSTSGTTASVVIIKNHKLYIGHAGDSGIVIGRCENDDVHCDWWRATQLTEEHKPSNPKEKERIERVGGCLMRKAGIDRVVWCRPKINPMLNTSRSTSASHKKVDYERIPFLAVARSLGDLWSYDIINEEFHVSPEPDVTIHSLQFGRDRCIILGSDGLWNMVSKEAAVEIVRVCERESEKRVFLDPECNPQFFYNPAASLVKYSVKKWNDKNMHADNISALVILLDPPGPSMSKRREERRKQNFLDLEIPLSFPPDMHLESFLLSSFLVECANWKNANQHDSIISNLTNSTKELHASQSQAAVVTELETIAPLTTNKPAVSKSNVPSTKPSLQTVLKKRAPARAVLVDFEEAEERSVEESVTEKELNISTQLTQADNDRDTDEVNDEEEEEEDEVECNSNSRPRVTILTKEYFSKENYTKYTLGWRNDIEIWGAIAEDLWILECFTISQIKAHISNYGEDSIPQRLEVLPWGFASKRVLSDMTECRLLASNFDLFHPVWLRFYERHIRPIVGAKNFSKQKMFECINSLKNILVPYLKETLKSNQQSASSTPTPPVPPTASFNKRNNPSVVSIQSSHPSEPLAKRPTLVRQNGAPVVSRESNLPPIVPLRIHNSSFATTPNVTSFLPLNSAGRSVSVRPISAKYMARPIMAPNEEFLTRDIERRMQSRFVNPMSIPGARIVESVVARQIHPPISRFSLQTSTFLKRPMFALSSQTSAPSTLSIANLAQINSATPAITVEEVAHSTPIVTKTTASSVLISSVKPSDSPSNHSDAIEAVTTAVPDSTSKEKRAMRKKPTSSSSPRSARTSPRKPQSTPTKRITKSVESKSPSPVQKSKKADSRVTTPRSGSTRNSKAAANNQNEDKSASATKQGKDSVKKIQVKFIGQNIEVMDAAPVVKRSQQLKRLSEPKKKTISEKSKTIREKISTRQTRGDSNSQRLSSSRSLISLKKSQPVANKRNLRSLRTSF